MKVTKRQLRRIIREQLEEEQYVVIGNAGRGQQNMWPKSEEPELYSKEEAEAIAKEQNAKSRSMGFGRSIHYHAKPLSQAGEYIEPGQPAHAGLAGLLRMNESTASRVISERGTGNPELATEERNLKNAVIAWVDKYRLVMGMDPNDFGDDKRIRRALDDMIGALIE
tara:strand:+ start:151 stop:651 length:501 start_codon:yes stop_codon:yes gene_type:complete